MTIKQILKNKEIILITLLGLFLRFYKIKERFFWGTEQSLSLWPIVRLFEEKKLTLIGIHLLNYKSALFRPPFFIYIFALPLKIFNFNPFVLEVIFALIGLLVIILIYLSAEKIFGKLTAIISSLLYATSFSIINIDKNVWTITPIAVTSAAIIFFLTKIFGKSKRQLTYFLIIGFLVGLGFSFHFQTTIILTVLLLLLSKKHDFKKTAVFLIGALFSLLPIILFNLRHDFIMVKAIKNVFWGEEIITRQNQNLINKLNDGLQAFSDLSLGILNLPSLSKKLFFNSFIFLALFLLPSFYNYKKGNSEKETLFSLYFLFSCFASLIGITIINPSVYRSISFYLWFLIPLLLITWARFLSLLFKKNTVLLLGLLSLFIISNLYSLIKQKPGNYNQVVEVADYILKTSKKKKLTIKFINREVLAYDYIFYYRAPFYDRHFKDINLIEQWQNGKPDFFIIHGNYNWKKDKYHILPYKKIINLNSLKIAIK